MNVGKVRISDAWFTTLSILSIYHSLVGEEVVVVTLLLVETKHSQVSELVSYSDSFHCQRIVGGTAASQAINKRKCRGR